MSGLAPGNSVVDREDARNHTLDIAVDHGNRLVEGDRGDCRGCVGADTGQLPEPSAASGKRPPGRAATTRAQAMRLRARE